MSDGNLTLPSERWANIARWSSRCIFQRASSPRLRQIRGLQNQTPRTGIIGPALTGSWALPAPSHWPFFPGNATLIGNRFHPTDKKCHRVQLRSGGTTPPISVTFLNGLTGGARRPLPADSHALLASPAPELIVAELQSDRPTSPADYSRIARFCMPICSSLVEAWASRPTETF